MGIDSLYLVIEYPKRDIFDSWACAIEDDDDLRLNEGILHNGMLIRRGLLGYKYSVWDDDSRLLISKRVDNELRGTKQEGHGMGLMLQLGPKWLRRYGEYSVDELVRNVKGQLAYYGVRKPEKYPIRINRIDFAVDVLNLSVEDFSTDEWRRNWIGYAKKMSFFTRSDSRALEGLSIGTSSGSVRFKVYDKVAESEKRRTSRFWKSVWGIEAEAELVVARFEWTIKCYQAKFSGIRYLSDLSEKNLASLVNYASMKWGRLSKKTEDGNKWRWPSSDLWAGIEKLIENWNGENKELASREYDFRPDISDAYLNSYAGWTAGLQVRVGIENEEDAPADFGDTLIYLQNNGLTLQEIGKRAANKWTVAAKLAGKET